MDSSVLGVLHRFPRGVGVLRLGILPLQEVTVAKVRGGHVPSIGAGLAATLVAWLVDDLLLASVMESRFAAQARGSTDMGVGDACHGEERA